MINIQSFEGVEFEHFGSYQPLLDYLNGIEGYDKHRLKDSYSGLEINGYSIGDLNKPTIFIDGQIHSNHEWGTSHHVAEFMKIIKNPPPIYRRMIDRLKTKYSFYFIPCVNPDGYNRGRNQGSHNDNGVHIDRNFDYRWEQYSDVDRKGDFPFSETEAQNIRDVVLEVKPVAYLNLHTWGGGDGTYVRQPQNNAYELIMSDYIHSIHLTNLDISKNYTVANGGPSSYNWVGEQDGLTGRKIISSVLETGNQGTTSERVVQSSNILNGLLLFCLHVDNYLTTNRLII